MRNFAVLPIYWADGNFRRVCAAAAAAFFLFFILGCVFYLLLTTHLLSFPPFSHYTNIETSEWVRRVQASCKMQTKALSSLMWHFRIERCVQSFSMTLLTHTHNWLELKSTFWDCSTSSLCSLIRLTCKMMMKINVYAKTDFRTASKLMQFPNRNGTIVTISTFPLADWCH